jgi:hypothetical protein
VLAIRDLRQRVALGMEVDLNIVDLLEVGTGAGLVWHAFVWARVIQLSWGRVCVCDSGLWRATCGATRCTWRGQWPNTSKPLLPHCLPWPLPPGSRLIGRGPLASPRRACSCVAPEPSSPTLVRRRPRGWQEHWTRPWKQRVGRSKGKTADWDSWLSRRLSLSRVWHSHDGVSRTFQRN